MAAHGAPWYIGGDEEATQRHRDNMQDQYVGNFADYQKYVLIRALKQESGLRVGVCWMKRPNGERMTFGSRWYLGKPRKWERHDPELFHELLELVQHEPTTTDSIENLRCMNGISYFSEPMPAGGDERRAYMEAACSSLSNVDVIFLDPDTGMIRPDSRVIPSKAGRYLTLDEIALFYDTGKSLLIYHSYPPFSGHKEAEHSFAMALYDICQDAPVMAFGRNRLALFLVVHPNHQPKLVNAAFRVRERLAPEMLWVREEIYPHSYEFTSDEDAVQSLRQ